MAEHLTQDEFEERIRAALQRRRQLRAPEPEPVANQGDMLARFRNIVTGQQPARNGNGRKPAQRR